MSAVLLLLPQLRPTNLHRLRSLLLVPVILVQRPQARKLRTPRHHGRKSLVLRDRLRSPIIIKTARKARMMARKTARMTVHTTVRMMARITDK